MEAVIERYMATHGVTMQMISKLSGVAMSTLSNAFNKPVVNWSIRVLNAVSMATGEKPSHVLKELQPETFDLMLDDEKRIIQGVQFDDEYTYNIVRNATHSNVYEGWEPTTQDIQRAKNTLVAPAPELVAHYHDVLNKDY